MTRACGASLRLASVTRYDGAATLQAATYAYDPAGRLQTVTADGDTATGLPLSYAYAHNAALPREMHGLSHGASQRTRMPLADGFCRVDHRNPLGSVTAGWRFGRPSTCSVCSVCSVVVQGKSSLVCVRLAT